VLPWQRDGLVLSLVVGPYAGALLSRPSRGGAWQLCRAYEGAWASALPQALAGWASELTSAQRVEVCIDAAVAQHWVSQAPQGARTLDEVQAYAMARRAQLFGDSDAQAWAMRADWHASQPFLCVAMPEPLVATIRAWCEAGRVRWHLRSALTELLALAALSWQGATWWSVGTPSFSASCWLDESASVNHLRTWRVQDSSIDDVQRTEALRTELARAALREGMDEPLHWIDMSWDGRGYVLCRRDMQGSNRTVLRNLEGLVDAGVPVSLRCITALASSQEVRA